MATEAVLILIDRGLEHAGSVAGVDARNVFLGDADQGRNGKYANLFGAVRIVAVNAGGVAVVVQQRVFGGVVRISGGRKWMPDLGRRVFGEYVGAGRHRRDIRAVVAGYAVLLILTAQQPCRAAGIVWRMAGNAGSGGHGRVTSDMSLG